MFLRKHHTLLCNIYIYVCVCRCVWVCVHIYMCVCIYIYIYTWHHHVSQLAWISLTLSLSLFLSLARARAICLYLDYILCPHRAVVGICTDASHGAQCGVTSSHSTCYGCCVCDNYICFRLFVLSNPSMPTLCLKDLRRGCDTIQPAVRW